jgi:hypothetical protein
MENEALSFMEKRKKIEEKRKKEMVQKNEKMFKEILAVLVLAGNISISFLPTFIQNEIKPIVDKYKNEQSLYVDNFIRDDYRVGIEQAQKILSLSNEPIDPYDGNTGNSEYDEVLASLLLYADRVIDNQHQDILNHLNRDITSIYISNKRLGNKDVEKDEDTKKNSTINTILTGAAIGKYINPSFKNINNRTDMTAQNETNRALNHGILMRYLIAKRDNFSGLMVKWVEVRDERLCKYCQEAASGGDLGHGIYHIDDITPPPLHSRCRCILIPYLERWGD